MEIKDFVGESGTALKHASESLDRVVNKAAGVASLLIRSAGGKVAEVTDSGPKDLLVVILSELRSIMAQRPGAVGIQAIAEMFRAGVQQLGRSGESAKDRWAPDAERVLRQMLMLFYVYLFYPMDDCLRSVPALSPFSAKSSLDDSKGQQSKDARTLFDLKKFVFLRSQMGDSKNITEFLTEFRDSQMFERFCAQRFQTMSKCEPWKGGMKGCIFIDSVINCCRQGSSLTQMTMTSTPQHVWL